MATCAFLKTEHIKQYKYLILVYNLNEYLNISLYSLLYI